MQSGDFMIDGRIETEMGMPKTQQRLEKGRLRFNCGYSSTQV